jgi:hypothetical protein
MAPTGDLGALTRPGTYLCSDANTSAPPFPPGQYFLEVKQVNGSTIFEQRATHINQPQYIATRMYVSGAWGPWRIPLPNVSRYSCRVYRTAAFTFTTANTQYVIPWDTKAWDLDNCVNISNGTYTCPVAGLYLVRTSVSYNAGGALQAVTRIVVNGTVDTYVVGYLGIVSAFPVEAVATLTCNANDAITTVGSCNAASVALRVGSVESYMAVIYLGQFGVG